MGAREPPVIVPGERSWPGRGAGRHAGSRLRSSQFI